MAAPFSMSKESEKYVVIANQCRNTGVALSKDSLRSQSPDFPRTTGGAQRLPLLTKGSCPSAHTGAEGIRTISF